MTAEQKFYQWFRMTYPNWDMVRIENAIGNGMPDVNVCNNGQEIWVELKVITKGRTLIRPDQHAWGHRRASKGGKVFILSWHEKSDNVLGFKFPGIVVEGYQGYLSVLGQMKFMEDRVSCRLKLNTFLFPPY